MGLASPNKNLSNASQFGLLLGPQGGKNNCWQWIILATVTSLYSIRTYGLFDEALSSLDYRVSNGKMINN